MKSKLASRPKTAGSSAAPQGVDPKRSLFQQTPSLGWVANEPTNEAQGPHHLPPSHSSSPSKKMKKKSPLKDKKNKSPTLHPSERDTQGDDDWSELGGTELLSELPIQTSIPLCLHHIIDTFIRRVLPWQVTSTHVSSPSSLILSSILCPVSHFSVEERLKP